LSRRKFSGDALLIASHNPGKVREISALLTRFGIDVSSAAELNLPEPEETGDTFVANAELKALAAATKARRITLADDSGLVVPALGGDPGIRSARWAGPGKDFAMAMEKVKAALDVKGDADMAAYFVCALTLAWPDGHVETVEGKVHGQLTWPPRGVRGFGYDPMFVARGYDITFGEMDPDRKHEISHRADAFRKLIDACFST
jgi:XTP/dITP diphosphohydrolase